MPIVTYRLYNAGVITAQLTGSFVRDGRLVGARVFGSLEAAAGTTTFDGEAGINIGTTVNYTTNNPDRKSAVATAHALVIAATAANYDSGFVPCDQPIRTGDVFSYAFLVGVTAPTRAKHAAEFFVDEK